MAWHRTIFNRWRSLADGYGILDLTEPVSFHAGVPGSADRAPRPQVLKKYLFQHAARLNEQAAIDRHVVLAGMKAGSTNKTRCFLAGLLPAKAAGKRLGSVHFK